MKVGDLVKHKFVDIFGWGMGLVVALSHSACTMANFPDQARVEVLFISHGASRRNCVWMKEKDLEIVSESR